MASAGGSELAGRLSRSVGWQRHLMLLGLLLFVITVIYAKTFASMVDIWLNSVTFNHGLIIPLISGFLIWQLSPRLKRLSPVVSLAAVPFLAMASLGWFLAEAVGVQALAHFAAVSSISLAVWAILGTRIARVLVFPLGYLLFAVPVGEFLVPTLQDVTAEFSVLAVRLTGIPILLEGRYIAIPGGNFVVAEACSGVRYLIAFVALGTLYAYLTYRSMARRLVFVGLSLVIPVVANVVRVFLIIVVAHYSEFTIAVGVDHVFYGWVFFCITLFLMFWVGSRFKDHSAAESRPADSKGAAVTTPTEGRGRLALALVLPAVLVGPVLDMTTGQLGAGTAVLELPRAASDWQRVEAPGPELGYRYPGADLQVSQVYARGTAQVLLIASHYERQRQGHEVIAWGNRIFNEDLWRRVAGGTAGPQDTGLAGLSVDRLLLQRNGRDYLIWHWAVVAGHPVANEFVAKLRQLQGLLRGDRSAQHLLLATEITQVDARSANALLAEFLRDVLDGRASLDVGATDDAR